MYSNSYKMLYVTTLYHKIATMYSIIHTGLIHSDDVHTGPVTLSCDLPCDHVTMSIVWSMHVETHVRCHVVCAVSLPAFVVDSCKYVCID